MRRKQDKSNRSSWRDLQKSRRSTKATTKTARKRRLVLIFRGSFVFLVIIAGVAGILGLRYFGKLNDKPPVPEAMGGKVELDFQSNGVLTKAWLEDRLGTTLDSDIRDIDVQTVKDLLESYGQVASATVTKSLPVQLVVNLQEREPILRIRLRTKEGSGKILLIARDGVLYTGAGYLSETVRRLPGVEGIKLRKSLTGYVPLPGLDSVAYLLDYAKEKLPSVYRSWQVIDLSDWDPEVNYRPSLVRVKSSQIDEIVFATDGVEEQMERLAGILGHLQRKQMPLPVFIDLSFGTEAIIRYN